MRLQVGWTPDDQVIFDHLWGRAIPGNTPAISAPSILVWNKVDLVAPAAAEIQSQRALHTTFSAETGQSNTANAASSSMQDGSDGDVAAAQCRGFQSKEQHHVTSQTATGALSSPSNGFSAQPQGLSRAGDAQPNSEAQTKTPTPWLNASNADSRPGSDAVQSSPDLAGLGSSAATPTAADVTASATQRASQASSQSPSGLSVAPGTVLTSSSNQSASGDQVSAVHGIPSNCADAFAACVETCATTGLGLKALSAALLQLSDAPSLAAGSLCCICHCLLVKVVHNMCT